jgi:hypothetical protein
MDYARAVALAQRLIDKNGRTITIDQLSSVPVDANKPWKGPAVPTVAATASLKAVFLPVSSASELGLFAKDDELLKRVEQVALIAADGVNDLTAFHRITDVGSFWKVDWTRELKPGPTTILYAIGVKR